jgi:hypothetical protein
LAALPGVFTPVPLTFTTTGAVPTVAPPFFSDVPALERPPKNAAAATATPSRIAPPTIRGVVSVTPP